jgi:phage protein D
MANIPQGFSAPFFRVYDGEKELTEVFTRLRYVYDEEDSDEIEITLETDNIETADKEYLQEDKQLTIVWGFIGEANNIKKRTVWIREPKWAFGENNIVGTLKCTEKGTELKASSSPTVYKRKTLPGITKEVADKHGLTAYVEVPEKFEDVKLEAQPGETVDAYLIREREANVKKKLDYYKNNPEKARVAITEAFDQYARVGNTPEKIKEKELRDKYQRMHAGGAPVNIDKAVQTELQLFKLAQSFALHKNVPQANKSDLQMLKQLGQREPDGPWVVETRDDSITIKKRSFSQTPYTTYTYRGGDGRLLEFNPESKKRNKGGTGTNVGFSGWNGLNKTFFSGASNSADGDPSLTKAIEMLNYYKGISGKGGGKLVTGNRVSNVYLPFISDVNVRNKIDNAGNFNRRSTIIEVTVDDKVTALGKAIDEFNTKKDQKRKELYNALGMNPEAAYNQANNSRRAGELKKNQVTARVWGDPSLECGMIITIAGVSKKYLGNYYILKATHNFGKDTAYTVDLELTRHGHNTKINENYTDSESLGRTPNNKVGSSGPKPVQKKVAVKSNPPGKSAILSQELKAKGLL